MGRHGASVRKHVHALRHHQDMFGFCTSTGDFGCFHHYMAVMSANPADDDEVVANDDDPMFFPLYLIATQANQAAGAIGTAAFNYFFDNKEAYQTERDWKAVLNKRRAEDQERAARIIGEAYDHADQKIAQLPDAAKDQGLRLFLQGMTAVAMCWDAILGAYEDLFDEILFFLQKNWDGIQYASDKVVQFVKSGASFISKMFGLVHVSVY